MSYLELAAQLTFYTYLAISLVALILALWALVDSLTRGSEQFIRASVMEKPKWIMLNGAAVLGALFTAVFPGGLMLISLAALCIAGVYLAGPRREMNLYSN